MVRFDEAPVRDPDRSGGPDPRPAPDHSIREERIKLGDFDRNLARSQLRADPFESLVEKAVQRRVSLEDMVSPYRERARSVGLEQELETNLQKFGEIHQDFKDLSIRHFQRDQRSQEISADQVAAGLGEMNDITIAELAKILGRDAAESDRFLARLARKDEHQQALLELAERFLEVREKDVFVLLRATKIIALDETVDVSMLKDLQDLEEKLYKNLESFFNLAKEIDGARALQEYLSLLQPREEDRRPTLFGSELLNLIKQAEIRAAVQGVEQALKNFFRREDDHVRVARAQIEQLESKKDAATSRIADLGGLESVPAAGVLSAEQREIMGLAGLVARLKYKIDSLKAQIAL